MTILFDIDMTLFNTKAYGQILKENIATQLVQWFQSDLNTEKKRVDDLLHDYIATLVSSTDFDPHGFAVYVTEAVSLSDKQIPDLLASMLDHATFERLRFVDVTRNLVRLSRAHSLGIFSEGVEYFQNEKVDGMRIRQFFEQENTFIARRKLSPEVIGSLPANALIIDDKKIVVETLQQHGCNAMLIDRSQSLQTNSSLRVIKTLDELLQ